MATHNLLLLAFLSMHFTHTHTAAESTVPSVGLLAAGWVKQINPLIKESRLVVRGKEKQTKNCTERFENYFNR